MAQPQSNAKIEELRFRLKTDPKSRLFYPLAEELRKIGRLDEGEHVLRTGLEHHPTYLSAWVSLGRVLRDQHKDADASEALKKALQLDPGNVVAARLLADAYLALGEKLEALKKYKLVHALLPADQELLGTIERLDRELNPPFPTPVDEEPAAAAVEEAVEETPFEAPATPMEDTRPQSRPEPAFAVAASKLELEHQATVETPFADAGEALAEERRVEIETGDAEPMSLAHDHSPFEETAGFTAASFTVEEPAGMHIEQAPLAAEVPAPVVVEEEVSPFAEPEPARPSDDLTNTLTMADLYARQGATEDARQIYENILQRDPANAGVRAKLEALAPPPSPTAAKVARLQNWLTRIRENEEASRV